MKPPLCLKEFWLITNLYLLLFLFMFFSYAFVQPFKGLDVEVV